MHSPTYGLLDLYMILLPDARCKDDASKRKAVRKLIDTLTDEDGFPRPIPGTGLVWSARAVQVWIETGSAMANPASVSARMEPMEAANVA
jgi:hypothetical protein